MALTQTIQSEVITIPTRKRDRQRLLRENPGLLSAVARRHRTNVGFVCRVFHGQMTSGRVRAAILAELARRQARDQFASNGAQEGNGKKA
jgi:hypothetical protein